MRLAKWFRRQEFRALVPTGAKPEAIFPLRISEAVVTQKDMNCEQGFSAVILAYYNRTTHNIHIHADSDSDSNQRTVMDNPTRSESSASCAPSTQFQRTPPPSPSKQMWKTSLVVMMIVWVFPHCHGFALLPTTPGRSYHQQIRNLSPHNTRIQSQSSTPLHSIMIDFEPSLFPILFDPHIPTNMDTNVEVEILTDISHIVMDFSTFFSPSKSVLRCLLVLGRLIILYTDYLPDHTIHSEELVVQILLLLLTMSGRS